MGRCGTVSLDYPSQRISVIFQVLYCWTSPLPGEFKLVMGWQQAERRSSKQDFIISGVSCPCRPCR